MDLEVFVNNFAQQFEDTDEITADTEFQTLDEWDSLASLNIIAMVKLKYSKKITGAEIRECSTVKDIFDLLERK